MKFLLKGVGVHSKRLEAMWREGERVEGDDGRGVGGGEERVA